VFLPGIPQIYYVGLLAGHNDVDLLHATGVGRDINRHHYSAAEVAGDLERHVVQRLLALLRFRNHHPAFDGTWTLEPACEDDAVLAMRWSGSGEVAALTVDLRRRTLEVAFTLDAREHRVVDVADLPDPRVHG